MVALADRLLLVGLLDLLLLFLLDDIEIDVTDVPSGTAPAGEVDVSGDQVTGTDIV